MDTKNILNKPRSAAIHPEPSGEERPAMVTTDSAASFVSGSVPQRKLVSEVFDSRIIKVLSDNGIIYMDQIPRSTDQLTALKGIGVPTAIKIMKSL